MGDSIKWSVKPIVYYTLQNKDTEVIKESRDLSKLKDYRNTLENKSDYKLYEHIKC